jgi:hypothetical protein
VAAVAADDPAAWARSVATLFAGYDAESRGGSIGVHELVAGLAWFGLRLNPQQAEQLKADVDEDGTGRVTLADFSDQVVEGTRYVFASAAAHCSYPLSLSLSFVP